MFNVSRLPPSSTIFFEIFPLSFFHRRTGG